MKHLLYILAFITICIVSCGRDDDKNDVSHSGGVRDSVKHYPEDGRIMSDYYIQVFIDPDTIEVWQKEYYGLKPYIAVMFDGYQYDCKGWGGTEDYAIFKKHSDILGDSLFSGLLIPFSNRIIIGELMEINVVTIDDFDEEHKSGSSVSDIITFYGSSPVDYIKNGYKSTKEYSKDLPAGISYVYDLIKYNASSIGQEKVSYIDYYFFLCFDRLPSSPGTYTFEIEIKLSQKTLKNKVTMEF